MKRTNDIKTPTTEHAENYTVNKEDQLHTIPLRITDTTLRDAHQSLWATRMRMSDIMDIIDVIDNVGYYSLEMWGGATFDVCLRFLRENPWKRLRAIKAKAKKTPLQMLLRGQNLVGYRNYADDVVDRFVSLACENGIDIFRIFDALNDTRNLESAIKAVKKHGGHAQGTLCYTISPVHTVEKYVQYAKEQVALGIDSLCIKDMAGILSPIAAERLVTVLVKEIGIPIQVHCHATSGMATSTYVEAVRAGAGAIDCAVCSVAGFSSQPPVETCAYIFSETHYAANLDLDAIAIVAEHFAKIAPQRKIKGHGDMSIDPGILVHQIPGGMISNFRSQLDAQGALDKLPIVLKEVIQVREDLGYPPLVTPTSQIVGTQAVMNVLSGSRYKMVPNEVKEYVRGMYGKSPAPLKPEFVNLILGNEKPIEYRPADAMKPMLPTATEGLSHEFVENEEDIISFCILPEPAIEFFKWRKIPENQRPLTPAELEVKNLDQQSSKASLQIQERVDSESRTPTKEVSLAPILHADDYKGLGLIVSQASGIKLDELSIRKGDFSLSIRTSGLYSINGSLPSQEKALQVAATDKNMTQKDVLDTTKIVPPLPLSQNQQTPQANQKSSSAAAAPASEISSQHQYPHAIKAPIVGTFYSSNGQGKPPFVTIGDTIKKGAKVCIVEAMKLFNEIEAPEDCVIAAILVTDGQHVTKGQSLIAYTKIS